MKDKHVRNNKTIYYAEGPRRHLVLVDNPQSLVTTKVIMCYVQELLRMNIVGKIG